MKRNLFFALFTIILLVGCSQKNTENSILEETVAKLTSNDMDGRLTGTMGNDLAITYLEEQFKTIGLKSFIEDSDTYLVPYPHKFYDPKKNNFQVSVTSVNGEDTKLIRGIDFLERSGFSQYEETLPFTLDIKSPELDNSYVVLDNTIHFKEAFEKAKGILIVEDQLIKTLSINRMEKPIIQITKDTYNTIKKIKKGQITISDSNQEEMIEAYNVVGKISGKENKNAVVLSAHFDHVGSIGNTIYKGAIDNASGTAVLLDIARKLVNSNKQFTKDIIFVAYNGEESGLQGSYFFAEEVIKQYDNVYNINIDSLHESPLSIVSDETELTGDLLNDLEQLFKENNIKYSTDLTGNFTSDYVNFLYNHVNAVTISSQNVSSKIHVPTDVQNELDFSFLEKVSKVLAQFIIDFDNKQYEHTHEILTEGNHEDEHTHEVPTEGNNEVEQNISMENINIFEQERAKLKYGEYKKIQDSNSKEYYHIVNPSYLFNSPQQFKEYYPNIEFAEEINNFKLKTIDVASQFSEKIDWDNTQLDKVYKIKVVPENLVMINFNYYLDNKPNDVLSITLSKEETFESDNNLLIEPITIKNMKFYLIYNLEKTLLLSVRFEKEINNQIYNISISKGEEITAELDGIQRKGLKSSLTKEDIQNLIEKVKIDELIQKTIDTL